jgi:MoaA/NifB/PqqE/SkfB family radical SAM enzyme
MVPPITDLRLDLTSYCNERCDFCPFHGRDQRIEKGDYIDFEHYARVAEDLHKAGLHPTVRMAGSGEPTLYPEFSDVVDTLRQNGHRMKIITNGQRLEALADTIGSAIDTVIVSVHGGENSHDKLTKKPGAYQKAMRGLKAVRAQNQNINTILHFVITPENYREMDEHVYRATESGSVPRFQHLIFTLGNLLLGSFDLECLKSTITAIKAQDAGARFVPDLSIEQIDGYYDTSKPYIRNPHACKRILTDLAIGHDGKVIMCGNQYLGDITKESIVDIVYGEKRKQFVETLQREAASEAGLPKFCSRCCYN